MKTYLLALRPDLALLLEKYGIALPLNPKSPDAGLAKKMAKESKPPYDDEKYRSLALRLPPGWERITDKDLKKIQAKLKHLIDEKRRQKNIPSPNIKFTLPLVKFAVSAFLISFFIAMEETGDDQAIQRFARQITCTLGNGLDLPNTLFKAVSETLKTNAKEQKTLETALYLFAMWLQQTAAMQVNLEIDLLTQLSPLCRSLEDKVLLLDHSLARACIPFLKKVRLAGEKGDAKALTYIINQALEKAGINGENVIKNLKQFQEIATFLKLTLTEGVDQQTKKLTTLSQPL